MEIFLSCVEIQDTGYMWVSNYGLISWMSHCLISKDYNELSLFMRFLEKLTNFKSYSLHIKLITLSLVTSVTSINDINSLLKILYSNKIISHLNENDIKTVVSMVACQLGSCFVQKAKDMVEYGCDYVTDVTNSHETVSILNKLVYNWLRRN